MNIYRFEIYKRIKTLVIMPLCIGLFTFARRCANACVFVQNAKQSLFQITKFFS